MAAMRTLDHFIAELSSDRRAKVTARTKELIAEEKARREKRRTNNPASGRQAERKGK